MLNAGTLLPNDLRAPRSETPRAERFTTRAEKKKDEKMIRVNLFVLI